jgi:hypothetical protein
MPLSEYEQRVLQEMEQQLSVEDPKLATSMTTEARPGRRGRISLGILVALAGLALLIVGMVVGLIWISLGGFAVMFGGAYTAFSIPRAPSARTGARPRRRSGSLSQRFEERWERRRDES